MIPSPITVKPAHHSRRAALCRAGALTLALAAGVNRVAAQEATPGMGGVESGAILVQTFGSANLFRTQGSGPDLDPYTLYVRDVADRTLFFAERSEAAIGFVPTNRFIHALAAGAELTAALVAPPADINGVAEETESVWVLALSYWGVGEDPGELTYAGSLVPAADAEERFGVKVAPEPTWQNTGAGYFFIFGVPETSVADSEALRLMLG